MQTQRRTIQCPSLFRENVRTKLASLIFADEGGGGEAGEAEAAERTRKVRNIELSIYNRTIEVADCKKIIKKWENAHFCMLYEEKLRSIFWNLREGEGDDRSTPLQR